MLPFLLPYRRHIEQDWGNIDLSSVYGPFSLLQGSQEQLGFAAFGENVSEFHEPLFLSFLSPLPTCPLPPVFLSTSRTVFIYQGCKGPLTSSYLTPPSSVYIPQAIDPPSESVWPLFEDLLLMVNSPSSLGFAYEMFLPSGSLPVIFTHCFWLCPLELSRIIPLHCPH